LHIARGKKRLFALLAKMGGEFPGERGFTRALQAAQHQNGDTARRKIDRGRLRGGRVVGSPGQKPDHLFVDDLHNLLSGIQAFENMLADRTLLDLADKILDDLEVDIGFKEREAHLTQGRVHIRLGQFPAPAQALKGGLQFFGKRLEHNWFKRRSQTTKR